MRSVLSLLALSLLLLAHYAHGLECYTGFTVIRGRSVGTTTETCKKDSDQCYRMTVDVNTLVKGKLAGCSTYRCMISRNTCTGQGIPGQRKELCCCSSDRCNGHQDKTTSDKIRGALDAIGAGR